MNPRIFRSREVALLSEFIHELYEPVAAKDFAGHVVDVCTRRLREFASTTVFDETDLRTGAYAAACNRAEELAPYLPALGAHIHQHPGWSYTASGGPERVLTITDFLTQRQWRRTGLYHSGFKQMDTHYQFSLSLPGTTHICGLTLNHDRPIREEMRALLQTVAPHIERAHMLARRRTTVPALSSLTRREAEVLHWIAQGKRDGEIATVLGIAPRTVSKHVENILAKLGVETRGAAAACMNRA